MSSDTIRIPPYHYVHVQDRNSNITRLEMGPKNFSKLDHEFVVTGKSPVPYVFLQPYHYCLINDPVIRDADKKLVFDRHGQVKVNIGDSEIRTQLDYPEPFPLFPGETLAKIEKIPVVLRDCAIKLEALRDFKDAEGKKRVAGDEWIEFGPKLYIPRVEVKVVENIQPFTISSNQALMVRARRETKDHEGRDRQAGEEWLIRNRGFYIPGIDEVVEGVVEGKIINLNQALLLQAKQTFKDVYGKERKAGEEWLVTSHDASCHILDVHELFIEMKYRTILREDEFCYILNPVDEKGQNQLGKRILKTGP